MRHEKINICTKNSNAELYTYVLDNSQDIDPDRKRPMVIICPGGGYAHTSDREAEPVAIQMIGMGFHAAVLRYSVAPKTFPVALTELAASVAYLRNRSEEYHIAADKIVVCGFSAGGHLAASLGVYWDSAWLEKETGLCAESIRPNKLILCYPVISSGVHAHQGSIRNLMGADINNLQLKEKLSLEKHITANMPQVFLWHTYTDHSVPVENSLALAMALREKNVSLKMHIYPEGGHGLSLANNETARKSTGSGLQKECQDWIKLAGRWIMM